MDEEIIFVLEGSTPSFKHETHLPITATLKSGGVSYPITVNGDSIQVEAPLSPGMYSLVIEVDGVKRLIPIVCRKRVNPNANY